MSQTLACPRCKSTELVRFGTKWVRDNSDNQYKTRTQQYLCKKCGRITIHPLFAQPRNDKGRFTRVNTTSTTSENTNALENQIGKV